MKLRTLCALGLGLSTLFGTIRAEEPKDPAYELHEWGVISAPRNAQWAQSDMRAEWESFPPFFYKIWPTVRLPYHGPVRKPIIFLYPEKPLQVSLSVKFTNGKPLVWWPAATHPVSGTGDKPDDTLKFELRVGDPAPVGSWQQQSIEQAKKNNQPAPQIPNPDYMEVEKGHWIDTLRSVPCAKLFVQGGWGGRGGLPRNGDGEQAERFVYYDGLMQAPATPIVTRDGENLKISSAAPFEMLDVLVIERTENQFRFSQDYATIPAGKQETQIQMRTRDGVGDLPDVLSQRLVNKAGLTKSEADALVKIWSDGFFKRSGITLIYRVPQATYDAWLPLDAKPAPKKSVRVGLIVHEHVEPELEARIASLLKQLTHDNFETRDQARKALVEIGGAAFPQLEAAVKGDDPELRESAKSILNALDSRAGLEVKTAEQGRNIGR